MTINRRKIDKFFKTTLVVVFSLTLLVLFLPINANAAEDPCANLRGRVVATSTNGTVVDLAKDLPRFCTINQLYKKFIDLVLAATGSIAVLFIIIGGFQYLTSAGNEEAAEKGKKTLINSIIGLVVIIMAAAIVRIVTEALTSSSGTSNTNNNPAQSISPNPATGNNTGLGVDVDATNNQTGGQNPFINPNTTPNAISGQ